MSRFGESILHTAGRAVASGAWQGIGARAVQAFQNAQRLKMFREKMEADQAFREKALSAGVDYKTNFQGPAALQNAGANQMRAGASDLSSRVRAAALTDELAGGKASRGVLQTQAGRAPLGEVPAILGTYDPGAPQGGLTSPASTEVFQHAQEAQHKAKVREAAGKASVTQREIGKRQAGQKLIQAHVLPGGAARGLPQGQWNERRSATFRDRVKKALIDATLRGDLDEKEAQAMFERLVGGSE